MSDGIKVQAQYKAKTTEYLGCGTDIERVEIEKETDKCIWIKGKRVFKESQYANYYDTFDKAKKDLLKCNLNYISNLELKLYKAKIALNQVKSIKKN